MTAFGPHSEDLRLSPNFLSSGYDTDGLIFHDSMAPSDETSGVGIRMLFFDQKCPKNDTGGGS